jgi:hypothetical protein
MRNPLFFNQALCAVILDGAPCVDFMSGDAIRVTPTTEGSSIEVGFDRAVTTFSTDQSGTLELDFKGTSLTLEKINKLWKAQKTAAARKFSVQIVTSAAEPIRCEGCSISSPGGIATGGKTASARTVTINVEKISPQ